MKADIHGYAVRLERALARIAELGISDGKRKTILRFYDDCVVRGIGVPRLIKLVEVLCFLAKELPCEFEVASIDELKGLVRLIEQKVWSVWTKMTHKVILKKFYKWLKGNNEEYPVEAKWIKTTIRVQDVPVISQSDLVTGEDIVLSIRAARHPRDKAFLSVLAESGCRISEIGTLQVKGVAFDQSGVVLTVSGKTGSRRIRLVQSSPLLAVWLNCHPCKDVPDAPLWVNHNSSHHSGAVQYQGFRKMIQTAFKAAGIKKRCNPHLFRHSRASVMANHLTEFQMNHYFGWAQGSSMPSTYVHLSGKDLDGAILKMNGLNSVQEQQKMVQAKACYRCDEINSAESKYCAKCAAILDPLTAIEEQKKLIGAPELSASAIAELMKSPDVQKILIEKLVEISLKKVIS